MVMNHTDEMLNNMTVIKDGVNTTLVTVWPPLDMRGVTQPIPSTKDIIVIMFMILLWIYSIYLTARAYKKLLSDGRAETEIQLVDWWRFVLYFINNTDCQGMSLKHQNILQAIYYTPYVPRTCFVLGPFWKT